MAEEPSSAGGPERSHGPVTPRRAIHEQAEAGPGPATEAARRARSRSMRSSRSASLRDSDDSRPSHPPSSAHSRSPSRSPLRRSSRSHFHTPTRTRSSSPEHEHEPEREGSASATERSDEDEEEEEEEEEEEDEDEDYERQRRKRMLDNQSLLASLDILHASVADPAPPPQRRSTARRSTKHVERRDRHGYVVSLPLPGEKQVLAAIEVRTERAVRRAIDAGDYVDCTRWAEGEERRWRFGDGQGVLADGEEEVVGGVGPDFRWKTIEVVDARQEREAAARAAMEVDTPTPPPPEPAVKKAYCELPEGTCHQCRRRSDKPKMQCRNIEPECNNLFCETCCKRYHYFEFDEDNRSFICPVCTENCNCKSHLDEIGLGHLAGGAFQRPGEDRLQPGETVQHYIERYIVQLGKKEPPFDRIRLVNMAEDIVAPPLTAEWEDWLEEQRCERLGIKRKRKGGRKGAKPDKARKDKGGKGGRGKGGVPAEMEGGVGDEMVTGGKGKGKGRGKGKGKRPALRPAPRHSGGKSVELVEELNAAARRAKRRRTGPVGITLTIPARTPTPAVPSTTTSNGSAPVMLRIRTPHALSRDPETREIDSDGDTVHGYSSDESLRSRSRSLSWRADQLETTNAFLARMTSGVSVPTSAAAPLYPLDAIGMSAMDAVDIEGLHTFEIPMDAEVDANADLHVTGLGSLPPVHGSDMDHLPPMSSDHHLPIHGDIHLPTHSDLALPTQSAAHSPLMLSGALPTLMNGADALADPLPSPPLLRQTLAPAVSPTSPTSPTTPLRRSRFAVPDLSPPGHDPLPALYPTFPDLGSYPPYPPYSPPAYSAGAYSQYSHQSYPQSHSYASRASANAHPTPSPMFSPYTFSRRRDEEASRERAERGRSGGSEARDEGDGVEPAAGNGGHESEGEAHDQPQPQPQPQALEGPRKRRRPPPDAHIVRAPKHLQDQIDARMHQRA